MATFMLVPEKDWEVLKKYVANGDPCVVLVRESVAREIDMVLPVEIDYDCGSDPDVWIDVAHNTDHFAIRTYQEVFPDESN